MSVILKCIIRRGKIEKDEASEALHAVEALFVGAVLLPAAFLSVLAISVTTQPRGSLCAKSSCEPNPSRRARPCRRPPQNRARQGRRRARHGRPRQPRPRSGLGAQGMENGVRSHPEHRFLISPAFEILWPKLTVSAPPEDEISFPECEREFVSNKKEIPCLPNIVLAYRDEIARNAPRPLRRNRRRSPHRPPRRLRALGSGDPYRPRRLRRTGRAKKPIGR